MHPRGGGTDKSSNGHRYDSMAFANGIIQALMLPPGVGFCYSGLFWGVVLKAFSMHAFMGRDQAGLFPRAT